LLKTDLQKQDTIREMVRIADLEYQLVQREISTGANHTLRFAAEWAAALHPGDVVAFYGNLGSGKTTFIRGLGNALQVKETVTSPTFTLINEYRGAWRIYHMDLYRLSDGRELKELGLEEYFYSDGLCLVEWPEIVQTQLPDKHWAVRLSYDFEKLGPEERIIEILQLP
jgi:tRNA threonylcarbamoyladenosine biosynthesis protein TsaE